jgi:type IV secretory pathway VirB2 component (pilin)
MPACFEMLEKYLAFNKNFMKIQKIGEKKKCQSISGRKKTFFIFILALVFVAIGFHSVLAYTEADCNKYGGVCRANPCSDAGLGDIGSCWGTTNGAYCCGSPSAAQQQIMKETTPNNPVNPAGGGNQSSGFGNPLGVDSIEGVLGNIMSYLRGIAGVIAVIFIIIGGIMYMVSGGSKETTERAKKTLICAIAGLAIVLAAPLFYQEIKAVLSGSNPGSALQQILMNILKLLLAIVGFLAIISMVIGAIWMLTAVGDEERYELGKKTAGYSILGLVIALSALIIANQVTNLLGGSSTSSVINNAANSSMTGATVPSLPASTSEMSSTSYSLVGITEANQYAYKGSDGNYYEMNSQKGMTPITKNDVNPVTVVGTLEGNSAASVYKDTYGNYYKTSGNGVIPFGPNDVLKK